LTQHRQNGAVAVVTPPSVHLGILTVFAPTPLHPLQEAMLLRVRQRGSTSVLISVNRIAWALSRSNQVFVRAELRGLTYQTSRDRDHTGGGSGPQRLVTPAGLMPLRDKLLPCWQQ
jgi:hypothetical protein